MRLGELADRAGVSAKAIRYYERIGVLPPAARTGSGYRSYEEADVARLRFIRAAQAVGLRLGEIRGVMAFRDRGEPPCDHVRALIERRSYKPAMPPEEAFAVLIAMGDKLDRDLVRVFGDIVLGASVARLGKTIAASPVRGSERAA